VTSPLHVEYFSDLLCVWAYVGQARLDQVVLDFGSRVTISHHYVSIYGDAQTRIDTFAPGGTAESRERFAEHVHEITGRFEQTRPDPRIFREVSPKSSNQAHLVLCALRAAIQTGAIEDERGALVGAMTRGLRLAFFERARDIGRLSVIFEELEAADIPRAPVESALEDGRAMAQLSYDLKQVDLQKIAGSPTYVLDGGREKLFGNVGYRIIQANLEELLERVANGTRGASWC
jgi:predicted DsbA family dithiol-disulfide isomerase